MAGTDGHRRATVTCPQRFNVCAGAGGMGANDASCLLPQWPWQSARFSRSRSVHVSWVHMVSQGQCSGPGEHPRKGRGETLWGLLGAPVGTWELALRESSVPQTRPDVWGSASTAARV